MIPSLAALLGLLAVVTTRALESKLLIHVRAPFSNEVSLYFLSLSCASNTSSLTQYPPTLAGEYPHTPAAFGPTPYLGGLMHPSYFYEGPNHCHIVDPHPGDLRPHNTSSAPTHPYILYLMRSDLCPPTAQARAAQSAGAAGLVLLDYRCRCGQGTCQSPDPCRPDDDTVLLDDGSGDSVSIPTVALGKQEADKILSEFRSGYGIVTEVRYTSTPSNDILDYHLWTTPADPVSTYILNEVYPIVWGMKDETKIHLHQYLYSMKSDYFVGTDFSKECLFAGRYCARGGGSVTGAAAALESLRRTCLKEHMGDWDDWFAYVEYFGKECHDKNLFDDKHCMEKALKQAKHDKKGFEDCMHQAGTDYQADVSHPLLETEIALVRTQGIVHYPAMVVHDVLQKQPPLPTHLINALCDPLEFDAEICNACANCPAVAGCIALGNCEAAMEQREKHHEPHASSHPLWSFVKGVLVTVLVGVVGYVAYLYYLARNSGNHHTLLRPGMEYSALGNDADLIGNDTQLYESPAPVVGGPI